MKVVIRDYRNLPNPPQEIAWITLTDGKVSIEAVSPNMKQELLTSVYSRNGKLLNPNRDAQAYMEELPYFYNGSYFRAEVVET